MANPRVTNAWPVVLVLTLCGLAVVSLLYVSIPLVPLISRLYDVSPASASWVSSGFGFVYACGFLVFGPLSDRYGRKPILVLGLVALGVTTMTVGFTRSFTPLLLLRAVQGFVAATFAPAALAYVGEALPEQKRAAAIASISTGFLLAGILGQLFSAAVSAAYGWPWVFWVLALLYGVAALSVKWWVPGIPPKSQGASFFETYSNMAALVKRPALLCVYGATVFVLFSFVAMYSALGPYVTTRYQLNAQAMLYIRVAGIPGMLLSPLTGQLIRRWGISTAAVSGLTLAALGLGLEAASGRLGLLVAASVVFVAGISSTVPALIALVGSLAGEARGAATALYTFVLFVGASLGPIVANGLSHIGFVGTCSIMAVALLLAAVVLRLAVPVYQSVTR